MSHYKKAGAKDFAECPDMVTLRQELTKRGIKWHDESCVIDLTDGRDIMLRTKWRKDDEMVSVIWGYMVFENRVIGKSYGYPSMLECWYESNDKEPIPMTLQEILEVCA